jgi:hypothetical protein
MTPNPIKKLEHVKSHIRQSWPPPEAGVRSIQPIKPNNEQPSEMIISQYECLNFMRVWCGLTKKYRLSEVIHDLRAGHWKARAADSE